MTDTARRPLLLPMAGHVRGKRSPVTCALKCANACSTAACNTSHNSSFRDIVARQISRRSALGLGLAGAVTVAVASAGGAPTAEAAVAGAAVGGSPLAFTPIAPVPYTVDEFTVPEGFAWLAFLFGLPWLLWHRLWLEAVIYVAGLAILAALLPVKPLVVAAVAVQWLLGAEAQDLRRAAMARRGFRQAHVVAEADADRALARVLAMQPELSPAPVQPA